MSSSMESKANRMIHQMVHSVQWAVEKIVIGLSFIFKTMKENKRPFRNLHLCNFPNFKK